MLHALLLAFALTQETQPATQATPATQAEQHTPEELRTAAGVIGLDLTEDEAQLALRDVVENLESFRRLRGVELDNSIAPVLTFSPTLLWIAARHPRQGPLHGAAR